MTFRGPFLSCSISYSLYRIFSSRSFFRFLRPSSVRWTESSEIWRDQMYFDTLLYFQSALVLKRSSISLTLAVRSFLLWRPFFFVVALGDADYVDQPGSGDYRLGECLQVFSYLLGVTVKTRLRPLRNSRCHQWTAMLTCISREGEESRRRVESCHLVEKARSQLHCWGKSCSSRCVSASQISTNAHCQLRSRREISLMAR